MGRVSTKEDKTKYQICREALGLSRDKASELLESIPPERIEKIENEKVIAHPEEILIMAEKYKAPHLCNYYCTNDCEIGERVIPKIEMKGLSSIVLEMVSSLNGMKEKQKELIDITADGKIDENEIEEFVNIEKSLEKISSTVESLKLWADLMVANGRIDMKIYNKYKDK